MSDGGKSGTFGKVDVGVFLITDHPLPLSERDRLREALTELVEAATAEANEKGCGGYLGARLSDARAALGGGK